MADHTMKVITNLKEIVDKNSPNYLTDEPYAVFSELIESGAADRRLAGAIMYVLASGLFEPVDENCTVKDLSGKIQSVCSFNKKMADRLAAIFLSLYSLQNREEWKRMDLQGLEQFKKNDFSFKWNGFSVWRYSGGSVSCYYEADIALRPTSSIVVDPKLAEQLKKNPFMTKEAISDHYINLIKQYLDYEFEDYCTCDDYYQPVVEDFMVDRDAVKTWCMKNGFELVECEGDGYDGGYEPDIMRGGYW